MARFHPGPRAQFRVSIARGGVDVVDPVLQEEIKDFIGRRLIAVAEGGSAKKGNRALVTGSPEGLFLNHRLKT